MNLSNQDLRKWIMLRSIEWCKWPLFISQIVAPIMLIYWPWYSVVIFFLFAQLFWQSQCYKYVGINALKMSSYIVRLKWLICPISAYILYKKGLLIDSVFALIWPIIITLFSFFLVSIKILKPPQIGIVEKLILDALSPSDNEIDSQLEE